MSRRVGRSLQRQIAITTAYVAIAAILITSGFAIVAASVYLSHRSDSSLASRVDNIRSTFATLDSTNVSAERAREFIPHSDSAATGNGTVLLSHGHVVVAVGVTAAQANTLAKVNGELSARAVDGVAGHIVSTVDVDPSALSIRVGDATYPIDRVVLTLSTRERGRSLRLIAVVNAIGSAIGIALVLALTTLTVRRGLRPLRQMADRAEAVASGDHTARLPVNVSDPSMARLSRTVNAAFDVQQDAEHRMRAFVADAGHELRTPLTVAVGWSDLYLQGGLTDTQHLDEAMARIRRQLDRLQLIANDLSLLARTDQGRSFEHLPVNLSNVVQDVVDDLRILDPDRIIVARINADVSVMGDAARLTQVVRNLVGNAVQHTDASALIEVDVHTEAAMATLDVTDHGGGISEQDLPHIFERFWRADSSRARTSGGSGLGLAIAQAIVRAHSGTISVTSHPGRGTTFRVRLP